MHRLTQENFNIVVAVNRAVRCLDEADLLTEETYQSLLANGGADAENLAQNLIVQQNIDRKKPLRLRFSEFTSYPKKALEICVQRHFPSSIEFFDDNDPPQPYPGIDRGGVKKQFYSDLLKNLFQEGVLFTHFESGLPTTAHPEDKKLQQLLFLVGKALSYMRREGLIMGRILPDSFFEILQVVQSDADASIKKCCLASILKNPQVQLMMGWLEGDESKKEKVLECLRAVNGHEFKPTVKKMRQLANAFIDDALKPYVVIASSLLSGISGRLAKDLKELPPEAVSERIQGTALDAEKLISLIHIETDDPQVLQKVEWLKERINLEAAQDNMEWLENLLFCVTAERAITANSSIRIVCSNDERCRARTCFNELAIPTTATSKEEFFAQLDLLLADKSFSMA